MSDLGKIVVQDEHLASKAMDFGYQEHNLGKPGDVVNDPNLTQNEKRGILASWASDAHAVPAAPALRRVPGSGQIVWLDDILDALRMLDSRCDGSTSDHKIDMPKLEDPVDRETLQHMLTTKLLKLRWMGLDEEAHEIEKALRAFRPPRATIIQDPRETD